MPIWLDVNSRSGVPIYVQLVEQIQRALEVGILHPGDALPTVRQLASELTIAPNTIVKAYGELERLGLIESRAGAGTTVRSGLDATLRHEARERLRERLHQLATDAAALAIDERELRVWMEAELGRVYGDAETAVQQAGPEVPSRADASGGKRGGT